MMISTDILVMQCTNTKHHVGIESSLRNGSANGLIVEFFCVYWIEKSKFFSWI